MDSLSDFAGKYPWILVVESITLILGCIAYIILFVDKSFRTIEERKDEEEGELLQDEYNHIFILRADNDKLLRENANLRRLLNEHKIEVPTRLEGLGTPEYNVAEGSDQETQ